MRNTGLADSGPFWVEVWACPGDPDYPWLHQFVCDSVLVENLPAGGELDISATDLAVYDSLVSGEYAVIGFVDRNDLVAETDETDNYRIVRHFYVPVH